MPRRPTSDLIRIKGFLKEERDRRSQPDFRLIQGGSSLPTPDRKNLVVDNNNLSQAPSGQILQELLKRFQAGDPELLKILAEFLMSLGTDVEPPRFQEPEAVQQISKVKTIFLLNDSAQLNLSSISEQFRTTLRTLLPAEVLLISGTVDSWVFSKLQRNSDDFTEIPQLTATKFSLEDLARFAKLLSSRAEFPTALAFDNDNYGGVLLRPEDIAQIEEYPYTSQDVVKNQQAFLRGKLMIYLRRIGLYCEGISRSKT